MAQTKSKRALSLEERIERRHNMIEGQVWSWEATGVCGTDICSICGLEHRWGVNGQNNPGYDIYQDAQGNQLTLAQAAELECA
jgi:hypothetical protein